MSTPSVTASQILAAQSGDRDAMWDIVCAYDPMMKSAVRSVAPTAGAEDAEDLLQEARAVLITRIRDYKSTSDAAQLYTYAYRSVRRAIAEQWLKSTTALTVDPSTALTVKRALWTAEGNMDKAWKIVSADADPKRRMSREAFIGVVEALAETKCLDTPTNGGADGQDGTITLADVIPDPDADFTDIAERRNLARWLMTEIPSRQSLALRAFYGVGMQRAEDAEVAGDMGVKLVALRQLRARGVRSAQSVAVAHDIAA
ncbi:sigma-70 family RNA polymerase sigma factor [Streptomyces chryseus]|uniref:sigma-70 family RNA polymerase sigma factor n=1 Tax=Streptomyces chryseus TaxID=68186 RepID=UPI00110FAB62|nr:sigma-70 family RNA polymerase sigma factor [Streptomyces chryseus]GGX26647.1 hypothetical protein GCM10010353_47130 [Streptomyces chryseus]